MSVITFYTPLQTKCYMLKKTQSAVDGWGGTWRRLREAGFQSKSFILSRDGSNTGGESVTVRGADMWEGGGGGS